MCIYLILLICPIYKCYLDLFNQLTDVIIIPCFKIILGFCQILIFNQQPVLLCL